MALPGDDQHRHLWQTFLQSDAGHAGLEKQHQEETDLHRADYKARIKPIQLRELADALEGCSRDVKRAVADWQWSVASALGAGKSIISSKTSHVTTHRLRFWAAPSPLSLDFVEVSLHIPPPK